MSSLAFVFPGQGSQRCGMLSSFGHVPIIRQLFEEASTYYQEDLWVMVESGPEAVLNQTYYTQIIMFLADVAFAVLWAERGGLAPQYLAGHSLGEYAALMCAGVFSFSDLIRIVQKRAQLMSEAGQGQELGMMAVLGGTLSDIESLCLRLSSDQASIAVANFNSPAQQVISGDVSLLLSFQQQAKAVGIKRCVMLPVSSAFHSVYMRRAADDMGHFLETERYAFSPPCMPIIHNYGVCSYDTEAMLLRALSAQIDHPVPWVETILSMYAAGVRTFVEMGPGAVLSGLIKKIVSDVTVLSFDGYEDFCQKVMIEERN